MHGSLRPSAGPRVAISSLVAALALAAIAAVTPAAGAPAPAPAQRVSPPAPDGASGVRGANADGDVYYNSAGGAPWAPTPVEGRIRHADGSIMELDRALADGAAIDAAGHLWTPIEGTLWSVSPDGTMTEHPVPGYPGDGEIGQVEVAPTGRIWFLDIVSDRVGSVAADGTDPVLIELPGATRGRRIAVGVDGRIWVLRWDGGLQAVAADGTVTSYAGLGEWTVGALEATASGLYAIRGNDLIRIAADGSRAVVAKVPSGNYVDVGVSEGWAWFADSLHVVAVSPSGRVAPFAMPRAWKYPESLDSGLSLAPDARGGFVGAVQGYLVELPSAAIEEVLTARATISERAGMRWLRVEMTARTPGGRALSGQVEAVMSGWASIPEGSYLQVARTEVAIGRATLSGGRAVVEVPITPQLVRLGKPPALLHSGCCSVNARRPGAPGAPGLSSPMTSPIGGPGANESYHGPVTPSRIGMYLDKVHRTAIGRVWDSAGLTYWAGQMGAGMSRTKVSELLVDSGTWRRARVNRTYQRFFGRAPTASELAHWEGRLRSITTTELDLVLGSKPAARDANGTSNQARAAHLAQALRLPTSYRAGFQQRLDRGDSWASVLRYAYWTNGAKEARIAEMGERSGFTPSMSALGSELARTQDERGPLVKVLATMPTPAWLEY